MPELALRTALWSIYLGCRGTARTLRAVESALPGSSSPRSISLRASSVWDGDSARV
jgi:hypothetical protein